MGVSGNRAPTHQAALRLELILCVEIVVDNILICNQLHFLFLAWKAAVQNVPLSNSPTDSLL